MCFMLNIKICIYVVWEVVSSIYCSVRTLGTSKESLKLGAFIGKFLMQFGFLE